MKAAIVPLYQPLSTSMQDVVRIMQPVFEYKNIQSIERGAPVILTVPEHGLEADWLAWITGVVGMPELNRLVRREQPHRVTYIDDDTLEINALSATGTLASGGQLIYQRPVDFEGATAAMTFYENSRVSNILLTLSTANGDLEFDGPGVIKRSMTQDQANDLVMGTCFYTFEVTFPDGSIHRYFEGPVYVSI